METTVASWRYDRSHLSMWGLPPQPYRQGTIGGLDGREELSHRGKVRMAT